MGGWGGQMVMFADKVGGWGWPNADVSTKKVSKEKLLFGFFFKTFLSEHFCHSYS